MTGPGDGLVVENLAVRYGGANAVDDVSLVGPAAEIRGLIGPNGAGKTSLFNAVSGLLRPARGEMLLHHQRLTVMSAQRRAAAGLGRTFQQPALVPSLSVRDNVAIGFECRYRGWRNAGGLVAGRRARRAAGSATDQALELCALGHLADRRAASLTLGQQRFVELARACAAGYEFLLLDEPASGLDNEETAEFGRALGQIVRQRGTGVLLVEHDMAFVLGLCRYVYVLDAGRLIFAGTPPELRRSQAVRQAYLGISGPGGGSRPTEVRP